jgi:outer membrane receptor protein involved in Fe transport
VINQINSLNDNFGLARVTGVDYELAYDTAKAHFDMPFPGAISFDLQLEEQYKNTQTNADGSLNSYVGYFQYSNETIHPHWKGLAQLEYTIGPWTAHWDTRFIEGMQNLPAEGSPEIIHNFYYHNLSGSFTLKDMAFVKNMRFVLGINNLFDKQPPFLAADSVCKCNTLAGPYDLVGRFVYGRVSAKF